MLSNASPTASCRNSLFLAKMEHTNFQRVYRSHSGGRVGSESRVPISIFINQEFFMLFPDDGEDGENAGRPSDH